MVAKILDLFGAFCHGMRWYEVLAPFLFLKSTESMTKLRHVADWVPGSCSRAAGHQT